MVKITFILLFLFFPLLSFCQGLASFRITAFKNNTNQLEDNSQLDTVLVQITSKSIDYDTTVFFSKEKNRFALPDGRFTILCSIDGEEEIRIENIPASSDKITFIEILFEPPKEYSKKEIKLRRKKQFANYVKW